MYGLDMVERSEILKRGTVYVTLSRMGDKGYVASRLEDVEPGDGIPMLAERGLVPAWDRFFSAARQDGADIPRLARRVSDSIGDGYPVGFALEVRKRFSECGLLLAGPAVPEPNRLHHSLFHPQRRDT